MTNKERICAKAIEILSQNQNAEGLRFSQLVTEVKRNMPEMNENTIHGSLWDLDKTYPKLVYKPERGLFRHVNYRPGETVETPRRAIEISRESNRRARVERESPFYAPFATYLKDDLGECSKAVAVGGSIFGDRWGTPDVIGVEKSHPRDIVKHWDEIISAEIKIDGNALITAFGQACSYKLFSHKVYLVLPKTADKDEVGRIESLCQIFDIGLILFDPENLQDPKWELRLRARKQDPDMFYLNQKMAMLQESGAELFG
jgi:hypothetical protein